MKLSSLIASRPICLFFTLALVVLVLSTLVISFWCVTSKRIEHAVEFSTHYIHKEMLLDVETAAEFLFPINSSAVNLATILHSSLNDTTPAVPLLPAIETKVALYLYLAVKTLPLSQITYIGLNGVFYSYYIEGNQTFVAYTNSSSPSVVTGNQNASTTYNCLTEPVHDDSGKRIGKAKGFNSTISIDSSWLQTSLNSTHVHASLGTSWGKSRELLFLSTAAIDGVGLVSLGLPVKAFSNAISRINLLGGDLYLVTKDGTLLAKTGNLSVMINNNSVSIVGNNSTHVLSREMIEFTCEPSKDPLRRTGVYVRGAESHVYCAPFEVAGVPSVAIMLFPRKGLVTEVHKNNNLVLALLIPSFACVLLSISFFIFIIVKTARREWYLSAALIKQKEATQQAERKSMNKSLAFASASHDVRSSLAALDGLISLCSVEVSPKSELHNNLEHMRSSVADLVRLLNTVLDTSKIEAGKMQLVEEEFDVAQVIEDSVNLYYPAGNEKGIDVVLDPCDRSVLQHFLVKGDPGKFKQVLNNLLHNAIKFTSEGSVTVRAWVEKPRLEKAIIPSKHSSFWSRLSQFLYKDEETYYNDLSSLNTVQQQQNSIQFVIEVDDTGKGIPKDKQKSVFEDFVQVKETDKGTGLGLGIVQSLVRLMGGEIRIMDKEHGERGTCFRFNVYFSACETTCSTYTERDDAKLLADHSSAEPNQQSERSIRSQTPTENSHVVLFIQGGERRKILMKFMQSLGTKVSTVDRLENLQSALKKIKSKWYFNFSSSGKSDMGSFSDYLSNSFGSGRRDGPMSARDGMDTPALYRKTSRTSNSKFILIVIDFSGANFSDDDFELLCLILESFRRDIHDSRCKVVWLYTPNLDIQKRRFEERKLAQCELVISKPLHGSRLHQVLRLLPEFGGATTIEGYKPNLTEQTRPPSADPGPSTHNKSNSDGLGSHRRHEIQQIGPTGNKPLLGKKVLIAEDTPTLIKIAKSCLDRLGATTECCEDGEDAVQLVRRALEEMDSSIHGSSKILPYDYIFMDCEMPRMNGYEATQKIRKEERLYGVYIPIIALTGHDDAENVAKGKLAGMDFHLTKPVKPENVLRAIHFVDSNGNI